MVRKRIERRGENAVIRIDPGNVNGRNIMFLRNVVQWGIGKATVIDLWDKYPWYTSSRIVAPTTALDDGAKLGN